MSCTKRERPDRWTTVSLCFSDQAQVPRAGMVVAGNFGMGTEAKGYSGEVKGTSEPRKSRPCPIRALSSQPPLTDLRVTLRS